VRFSSSAAMALNHNRCLSLLSLPLRRFQVRLSLGASLVARADFTKESIPNLRKGEQLSLLLSFARKQGIM